MYLVNDTSVTLSPSMFAVLSFPSFTRWLLQTRRMAFNVARIDIMTLLWCYFRLGVHNAIACEYESGTTDNYPIHWQHCSGVYVSSLYYYSLPKLTDMLPLPMHHMLSTVHDWHRFQYNNKCGFVPSIYHRERERERERFLKYKPCPFCQITIQN